LYPLTDIQTPQESVYTEQFLFGSHRSGTEGPLIKAEAHRDREVPNPNANQSRHRSLV